MNETVAISNGNTVDLARVLAVEIANQLFLAHWYYWAIFLFLGLLGNAVLPFVRKYYQTRGETAATKADIDSLAAVARATTRATEEIKAQFDKAGWVERETNAVRRAKLEELLERALEIEPWLSAEWMLFCEAKLLTTQSPLPRLDMLTTLYFPELRDIVRELSYNAMLSRSVLVDAAVERYKSGHTPQERTAIGAKAGIDMGSHYPQRFKLQRDLMSKGREIFEKLTTDGAVPD